MPNLRLKKILDKNSRLIIGLMSGMSLDGLDLALVEISDNYPNLQIELKDFASFQYSKDFRSELKNLKNSNSQMISEFNFKVADYYSECINNFLKAKSLSSNEIDAIGSHGQTIYHKSLGTKCPSTLQIGSGSVIASKTGIITVSNFREADISVGGQGAPLVPFADYLLFHNLFDTISLNNLGSISNLTVLPPDPDKIFAFDTGPANMPIDFFAALSSNNPSGIDKDGEISKTGKVNSEILAELLNNPYFTLPPPKAAGYQEFGPEICQNIIDSYPNVNNVDLVRTAVEFSAITITDAYKQFVLNKHPELSKIIFTGGGARNLTLISRIKELLPKIQIESLFDTNPNLSTYKEALCFAILANETLSGRPSNLPSVTGASRKVILGQISC